MRRGVNLHRKGQEIKRILYQKNLDFFREKCIILICMDTLIKRGSAGDDDLQELRNHQHIVGTKQLRKALDRGSVCRVFLARDADPAVTEPLAAQCERVGAAYVWVAKMTDLGRACGIDVGAAAAATLTAQS